MDERTPERSRAPDYAFERVLRTLRENVGVEPQWACLSIEDGTGEDEGAGNVAKAPQAALHRAYQMLTNASFERYGADSGVCLAFSSAAGRVVEQPVFGTVAVGGTFDRLHAGHKLLLSTAALHARSAVVLGVTDTCMHGGKHGKERIARWADRASAASAFLAGFAPGLRVTVVPLADAFGPAVDPHRTIDAIAVTEETIGGAHAINDRREALHLPELHVLVSPAITVRLASGTLQRLSSTLLRMNERGH